MKGWLLPVLLSIALYGLALAPKKKPSSVTSHDVINCGPSVMTGDLRPGADGKFITVLPGWGDHSYSISSDNDSARFYFNQGLNMYYSYHAREAFASFREATRFDPGCAMTYWGAALALGPGYNTANTYVLPVTAQPIVDQMNHAAAEASPREKDLIAAMSQRYQGEDTHTTALNAAYAGALRALIPKYPDDADIKTLYVDAMMLIHPWDFWNNDGTPKSWTPELVDLVESVLREHPQHPAALHYYIHLTEASRHPEVALASADVLKDLLPGVAHMVHMASHEYERNGVFAKGVRVNEKADSNLIKYNSLSPQLSLSQHIPHYLAVQAYCALSGGIYEAATNAAGRCRNSVVPTHENTYAQYLYMMPVLARVRCGKWKEILEDSAAPDAHWPYARVLHHFARGLALVYTGKASLAGQQLFLLKEQLNDPVLKIRRIPFNNALQGAGIAANILQATIFFAQKNNEAGINSLNEAIKIEDSMVYTEPRDWMIPTRQFLGAYLLQIGRIAQAEKVYRDDLVWNPGNGWSMVGLYKSLQAQHKKQGMEECKAGYLRSFEGGVVPGGSVYFTQSR